MNIIITGASGFVGSNLIPYLKRVTTHDILPVRVRPGDRFFFSTDCYIHLAGKAHDTRNKAADDAYLQVNFELTKQLYDHFLSDQKASCFIFMSSVKAAADAMGNKALTEQSQKTVDNIYGISKRKAEGYILSKLPGSPKRVYILRPCMIHGPGNKGNLNLLFKVVKAGIPYPLAAFDNERSFLSIDNLCFVIEQLLSSENIASGVYNVADDRPLSTNRVVKIMGEELKKPARKLYLNKKLIQVLGRMGDVLRLPFNTARLHKLTENYVVSNTKLVEALQQPLPVSSEDGLRNTIRSFC